MAEFYAALAGLFVAAFGAATFLPFPSEPVFVAVQLGWPEHVWAIVILASIGNTLGSVLNYGMGRWATHLQGTRWFPVKPETLERARNWYAKYGVWSLLLSWAPLGDAITALSGIMRTPLWLFVLLVGVAKTLRYIALAWITMAATG